MTRFEKFLVYSFFGACAIYFVGMVLLLVTGK
jgi:hypothetical protein